MYTCVRHCIAILFLLCTDPMESLNFFVISFFYMLRICMPLVPSQIGVESRTFLEYLMLVWKFYKETLVFIGVSHNLCWHDGGGVGVYPMSTKYRQRGWGSSYNVNVDTRFLSLRNAYLGIWFESAILWIFDIFTLFYKW